MFLQKEHVTLPVDSQGQAPPAHVEGWSKSELEQGLRRAGGARQGKSLPRGAV